MTEQHESNLSAFLSRYAAFLVAFFTLAIVMAMLYSSSMNRIFQCILVVVVLVSGVVIAGLLRNHERRHKKDLVELQQREENLSAIFNSIGDAVIVTDIKGNVVQLNPVAVELTGWTMAEASGKPMDDVFHIVNAQSREPAVNPANRVFETGKIVGLANHTMLIAKDGRKYHIADSAAPIRANDGTVTGVVLVFRDVTENYQMRSVIRESEQYLRSVFRAAPTGIGVVVDRILTQVNERICEITGYAEDELIGKSSRILYKDAVDYAYVGNEKYHQIREIGTGTVETQWQRKDGTMIDVLLSSTPMVAEDLSKGVTFTALDITHRKTIEKELHLSLKKYESTFQTAPVWVVLSGIESGRYIEVNNSFLELMGYRQEEVIGKSSLELQSWCDPEDRQKIVEKINSEGSVRNIEVQRRTKSGKIIDTLFSARPLRLENEEFLISVTQDISKWKQSENERVKLEEQFQQVQKLESIGRLAGGVAHDLNNLLSPIIGYGEMLLEDISAEDVHRDSIQEIVNAGVRARNLVHQLLAFSRKQTLEYKQLDMNEVANGVEKLMRRTIREDIEIQIITSPHPLHILGDIGQIEQMILNLATNASDAMPDGGNMTIETLQVSLDEEYAQRHQGVKPGEYVMLSVSDTGCGMDEETCRQIFEPFFSTKGKQGTGLGLATVYGIAKQHGGNIWVYSELGKGTTFNIFMPFSGKIEIENELPEPIVLDPGGAETILLVEDNDQVRSLVFTILQRKGYDVLVAEDGDDALHILDQHKGTLDLMLTDVVMPGMNGKELFSRVIERYKHLKVIYMSGYTANVIAHRGILDEGTDFIQKPFSTQDLAAKVREVLDRDRAA